MLDVRFGSMLSVLLLVASASFAYEDVSIMPGAGT
jgi:hypothetical protein